MKENLKALIIGQGLIVLRPRKIYVLLAISNRLAALVCDFRCKGSVLLCYCLVDQICYGSSLCYKELV
jgi:hypothetical protein